MMDLREAAVCFARRARGRLALVRAVETSQRALFYALCTALAAVVVHKLFGTPLPLLWSAAALGGVVLLWTLASALVPRIGLLEAAAAVDAQAGWKERLSSALAIRTVAHPMEQALVEDVQSRLGSHTPSRLFRLRAAREIRFAPFVAAAVAAAFLFAPQFDLMGWVAGDNQKKQDKKDLDVAVERLEQKKQELKKQAEQGSETVKELLKKMEDLSKILAATPPPEKKDALAEISKLSEEIQKMKDGLSKSEAMAEKIQKAAAKASPDAGELGKLMREGKFKEAVQELAKIRQSLKDGSMSEAQREKLQKQMEALAKQLGKDGDKDLSKLEKDLAKAMEALEKDARGDPGQQQDQQQALEDLQQSLDDLGDQMDDAKAMQQALEDLENLADALGKDQSKCPGCGQKKGEGG